MMPKTDRSKPPAGQVEGVQVVPAELAGRWVAWTRDGRSIVADGATLKRCEASAARAGYARGQVTFDKIPPAPPTSRPGMRFPYPELRIPPPPGGGEGAVSYFPMIEARVIGLTGSETVYGVPDTGAEDTLVPDWLIDRIGVHLKPGDVGDFRTADGRLFEAAYAMVDLEIGRGTKLYRWRARVAFVRRTTALFGFAGFLEHFVATFDGPGRHVTLKLTGKPLPTAIMPTA